MEKCGLLAKIFKNKKNRRSANAFFTRADTTVFSCYIKFLIEKDICSVQDCVYQHCFVKCFDANTVFRLLQIGNVAKLQIEKRFMRLRAVPNVLHPCAVQVLFLQVREAAECVSF